MEQEYYIYKVTCLTSKKCYIGQTQKYKHKNDKPYNYGINGRWGDHKSSAKSSFTQLHTAIRKYGSEKFTIEEIEKVSEGSADEREAYWIKHLNTAVPHGYNTMTHSRCKHRDTSSIANLYLKTATRVEMKVIKKNDIPTLIYVYITLPEGKKRITFGQSKTSTFEIAMDEATEFIQHFQENGIEVYENDKHDLFEDQNITKIRTVPFNKTMVAVYITTDDNKQKRICFGGKTITYETAQKNAQAFIDKLNINSNLKSQQQVATSEVKADTSSDK